ncbi:MAG: phosphate ABC transporter permease subunit PstC [Spirochaetaceae bacterium]|nr:phosphate ABC transporter permease subunit PstC [Spirochaetaceae bacterium]
MKRSYIIASVMKWVLLAFTMIAAGTTFFIVIFIAMRGLPLFASFSPLQFLFSASWLPTAAEPSFGIAAFIVGTFQVTLLALVIAIPISLASAIIMAYLTPPKIAGFFRLMVSLLAGIPSVVYGFFGIVAVAPFIREHIGGNGFSILTAGVILAVMIIPTIVSVSETSLRAVADEIKMGSLALGATLWQTIVRVLLPSAKSGISAAIALGMGRAMGETMAVLMVAGNAPVIARSLTGMGRTLTMNVVNEMGYASGTHLSALFATALVVVVLVLLLNLLVSYINRESKK